MAPGSTKRLDKLSQIVAAIGDDPALAFWKGADQPNYHGPDHPKKGRRILAAYNALMQLDQGRHPLVTIEAGIDKDPPAWVGTQGVDVNPVHGATQTHCRTSAATPAASTRRSSRSASATASRHRGTDGSVRLPNRDQLRFMAYDAIINGARALNFYGMDKPSCWTKRDRRLGWQWSEWNRAVGPVVAELSHGWIATALTATQSPQPTVGRGVETTTRLVGDRMIVIAAHPSAKATTTTIRFPDGSSRRDRFAPWSVHTYRRVIR